MHRALGIIPSNDKLLPNCFLKVQTQGENKGKLTEIILHAWCHTYIYEAGGVTEVTRISSLPEFVENL